jgi:hypothetical protein
MALSSNIRLGYDHATDDNWFMNVVIPLTDYNELCEAKEKLTAIEEESRKRKKDKIISAPATHELNQTGRGLEPDDKKSRFAESEKKSEGTDSSYKSEISQIKQQLDALQNLILKKDQVGGGAIDPDILNPPMLNQADIDNPEVKQPVFERTPETEIYFPSKSAKSITAATSSEPTVVRNPSASALLASYDDFKSNVLHQIPSKYHNMATELMCFFTTNPEKICWNTEGNITLENKFYRRSNICELMQNLYTECPNFRARGFVPLVTFLTHNELGHLIEDEGFWFTVRPRKGKGKRLKRPENWSDDNWWYIGDESDEKCPKKSC